MATKAVVKALLSQLDPDYVQSFWQARFPGQIPGSFVVPEVLNVLSENAVFFKKGKGYERKRSGKQYLCDWW